VLVTGTGGTVTGCKAVDVAAAAAAAAGSAAAAAAAAGGGAGAASCCGLGYLNGRPRFLGGVGVVATVQLAQSQRPSGISFRPIQNV
jgi:hypothetical protein